MAKKVHVLTRNPLDYLRETKFDIHKIAKNKDESLHPFAQDREYVKAMNWTKVQRMQAHPFVRSLDGGLDDVVVMSIDPRKSSLAAFGTADGRIEYWNISSNVKLFDVKTQDGVIKGISHFSEGNFLTCGSDKIVRHWKLDGEDDTSPWTKSVAPINSFTIEDDPRCLHTQLYGSSFAIGTSDQILVYKRDVLMTEPIIKFGYREHQSIQHLKFSPTETDILCALTGNNKICLYDIRNPGISSELKMTHKSIAMSFNPQLPVYFTTASDDFNLYTFDLRYFNKPIRVHTGFVKGVSDVSYSYRGNEFVAGSVDRTIRIFPKDDSQSREIYTAKRMGRILAVRYSSDDRYILSSSADQNVRLWKTRADEKLGIITPRETRSIREANKLCEKFSANPEIRKIQRRRRVPNVVKKLSQEHVLIENKKRRKERNIKMHAPPGKVVVLNKFEKAVVKIDE